ncbi:DNA polymerase epsilon subunit 3 [Trichonephila inaurata madagascariensis]|uniref:DNA polymerase epsilon subunit 3 n=1 Tax=Trichonephila inaurata madagascariensis TaxID=2747483 RepID=A0A8X6YNK3_9ARAC|nr:DNA polymerase epsilon subunit 3 [Trichonephila inaurata madagascariensis]GFY75638.1 DNA polymerase epsilon subunit 3 [Trichonephila inaurata madagascariensis]
MAARSWYLPVKLPISKTLLELCHQQSFADGKVPAKMAKKMLMAKKALKVRFLPFLSSSQVQATSQRKTLTVTDVYSALEDMLFEDMIDPIKECLEAFHADKNKKDNASLSPSKSNATPKPKRKRSNSSINKDTETLNLFNTIESSIPDLQIDDLERNSILDAIL